MGDNPCNFFSDSSTCTLHFNNSFFDKMANENVPFQHKDARIHDWLKQSTSGSRGSNPSNKVHQFIDGLDRLLDLIKSFFLLVALEAANLSKVVGHMAVKDRREVAEIGAKLDRDKA